MILIAFLIFLARSSGFPTSPTAIPTLSDSSIVPSLQVFRRAPWDHPNPETGLCDCPDTRNIVEILWTCASTLILATWVSVHLNIPPKGASTFRLIVLRFGAMLSTILAPEITLQWAIIEWRQARKLKTEMVELQKKMGGKQYPAWTMTHSFHVVTGGFALKDGAIYRPVKPHDFPTQVDRQFAFPTISEEEIKDKSKGDGLTKTLAIFQLLWFATQLIGRLAKGWAATELEVLTFATCIMTVVIYFFWWNKGLDVRCQTILEPIQGTEDKVDTEAHLSKPEGGQREEHEDLDQILEPIPRTKDSAYAEAHSSKPEEGQYEGYELDKKATFFTSHPKPQNRVHRRIFEDGFKSFLRIVGLPFVFSFETIVKKAQSSWGPDCANPISPHVPGELASQLWELYVPFLSASLFGAMHFITWSFVMPTLAELWMWRLASIALTVIPIVVTLCGAVLYLLDDRYDTMSPILDFALISLALCCLVLHPVIRLVISVDAVVLLRDLPDTAFLVLSWSSAIPFL